MSTQSQLPQHIYREYIKTELEITQKALKRAIEIRAELEIVQKALKRAIEMAGKCYDLNALDDVLDWKIHAAASEVEEAIVAEDCWSAALQIAASSLQSKLDEQQ